MGYTDLQSFFLVLIVNKCGKFGCLLVSTHPRVAHSGADSVEHTESEGGGVEENPILLSFLPFVIMAASPNRP